MRRKGELSPAQIDRNWPHQIVVPADIAAGFAGAAVHQVCKELDGCPRHHSFVHDGVWYLVYCFAKPEQAEAFRQRFGGEPFDPKRRGRGRRWHLLKPSTEEKSAKRI